MTILLTNPKNGKDYCFDLPRPAITRAEEHEGWDLIVDELGPICLVVERQERDYIGTFDGETPEFMSTLFNGQYRQETITSWDISDQIELWSEGPWEVVVEFDYCWFVEKWAPTGVSREPCIDKEDAIAKCQRLNQRDATWWGLLEKLSDAVIELALKGEL